AILHAERPTTPGPRLDVVPADPAAEVATRRSRDPSPTVAPVPDPDLDDQARAAVAKAGGYSPIPCPDLQGSSAAVESECTLQTPTLCGSPLVFLLVEEDEGCLLVIFPARPNQQTAWISRVAVTIERHRWHVEVDITANHMRV